MILHLGVNDIPYAHEPPAKAKRGKKPAKIVSGQQATGDVAEILERKYGIMAMFALLRGADIGDALARGLQGEMESLMMGKPPGANPFAGAGSVIETEFRKFLDNQEMDGRAFCVPTRAALMGVNHRLKIKRGAPRPSFIDTGLYQSSFRAWVD